MPPPRDAMFGQYSKPLHHPKPRHRDRRAGAATDALHRALAEPGDSRLASYTRTADERRQSRARLARRDRERPWKAGAIIASALLLVVFWLIASLV